MVTRGAKKVSALATTDAIERWRIIRDDRIAMAVDRQRCIAGPNHCGWVNCKESAAEWCGELRVRHMVAMLTACEEGGCSILAGRVRSCSRHGSTEVEAWESRRSINAQTTARRSRHEAIRVLMLRNWSKDVSVRYMWLRNMTILLDEESR